MDKQTIFDFKKDFTLQDWRIVDDIVMGGKSWAALNQALVILDYLKAKSLWKIMVDSPPYATDLANPVGRMPLFFDCFSSTNCLVLSIKNMQVGILQLFTIIVYIIDFTNF